MLDPSQAATGGFVEPRGMIRSVVGGVVAREVLGAVPPAVGGGGVDSGASPLKRGDIAYLAVLPDQVVLFRAKRGAFKPKPTAEVIAAGPLGGVRGASVERGRIAGVLRVEFTDGTSWEFDVPRVHLAASEAIAAQLARR